MFPLHRFDPSGNFIETLTAEGLNPPQPGGPTTPLSLAIDNSTDSFYVAGKGLNGFSSNVEVFDQTGTFLGRFGPFDSGTHVAIDNSTEDNSTEPSATSVYVADGSPQAGQPARGLEKVNASGEPVNFSGSAPYIAGNRITGIPGETFPENLGSIAIDSHGNIYAVNSRGGLGENTPQVDEYAPSGIFIRAITGEETPGLGESHEHAGWGGGLDEAGVAIDPFSGHLLVSLWSSVQNRHEGVIDEFDSSGHFLNQIAETSPGHPIHKTAALTVDSLGDLYLVEPDENVIDAWGPGRFLPGLRLAEATERHPSTALLAGEVNPEGFSLTGCHFDFIPQSQFEATGFESVTATEQAPCVPAAGAIRADSRFHSVEAALSGLISGTTYRYRLVATSSGELGGTATSAPLAFTALDAPRIDSTAAANISSTFADLHAQIRPLGAVTAYQFQYLTAAEYTENGGSFEGEHAPIVAPLPAAAIGSGGATGGEDASVLQHIGGLKPSTTYRFRVLASNEIGATAGTDSTFTTLPQVSPGLPDHRAYELVTPPNKGSAGDMFGAQDTQFQEFENHDYGYPSESGQSFYLETNAAFGPFPASGHNAYVFSRGSAGWTYTSLASPSLGVQSLAVGAFDPFDFSRVALSDAVGSAAGAAGLRATSLLGPPAGPYASLHADSPLHESEQDSEDTEIVGASSDLSHVVLESKNHTLAPGATSQDEGSATLYESTGGGECTHESANCTLLNLNPKGSLFKCGAMLGQGHDGVRGTYNAVSADGSRVFFTAPDPLAKNRGAGCWNGTTINAPQLYMRSGGQTIEVSAPEAGAPEAGGHQPAIYVGASEDGSKVFFISEAELTTDDAGIHDPELYEYDTEKPDGQRLSRISRGESAATAAGVFAVPAVSADGSAVYFMASGRLTAAAPLALGEAEVFLYRHDTVTGATVYVATLAKRNYPNTNATFGWWKPAAHLEVEVALAANTNWYTTPDGRYLLFATDRELTGYSTAEATPPLKKGHVDCLGLNNVDSIPSGHCYEVYRYDSAEGGSLACISCNPSGAPPTSNAYFDNKASVAVPSAGPLRALSDDGSYAFFDSADALVPQDGNATLDVYEWHEGKISLISSGQNSAPSFLLGASPSGRDVFFGTHARLVPADVDTAGDVYDARVDGGFPPPESGPKPCEGDACQSPASPPAEPTLSTSVPSGSGNAPSPAKKHPKHKKHHQKPKRNHTRHAGSNRRTGR